MHKSVSVVQSVWNFAQSTAVLLWNFKRIAYQRHELWANKISQDLGLRCIADGYLILHKAPVSYQLLPSTQITPLHHTPPSLSTLLNSLAHGKFGNFKSNLQTLLRIKFMSTWCETGGCFTTLSELSKRVYVVSYFHVWNCHLSSRGIVLKLNDGSASVMWRSNF